MFSVLENEPSVNAVRAYNRCYWIRVHGFNKVFCHQHLLRLAVYNYVFVIFAALLVARVQKKGS